MDSQLKAKLKQERIDAVEVSLRKKDVKKLNPLKDYMIENHNCYITDEESDKLIAYVKNTYNCIGCEYRSLIREMTK